MKITRNDNLISKIYYYFLTVFLVYSLYQIMAMALWVFAFDSFRIPSNSMYPTLIPGDKVFANKFLFGARLYESLDSASVSRNPTTYRIRGFRDIERNDILVFNFPVPYSWSKIEFMINYVYCKRCIGLPGDSVSVVNGIYKNSQYHQKLGHYDSQLELSSIPDELIGRGVYKTFPLKTAHYRWTIKNFGPLYIPQRGHTIDLDTVNYILYRLPIEYESGQNLGVVDGELHLGEERLKNYTFAENYYFVAGDNVLNSQDSRYWGFLPEKHIIGIVTHTLFSKDLDTGKYRWGRFWQKLK